MKKLNKIRIGSLEKITDIQEAIGYLKKGKPVVVQAAGVFGFICDGKNRQALELIDKIKESPDKSKPYSTFMVFGMIKEYVDFEKIHSKIKWLFEDHRRVSEVAGMVFHMRLPLNKLFQEKIPERLKSKDDFGWNIQNLDPTGRPIENLIRSAYESGIEFIAVTTLNKHGNPEITDKAEARKFLSKLKTSSMLFHDRKHKHPKVKGSFTILDCINLNIVRHGFVPKVLLEKLLTTEIFENNSKGEKYIQAEEFFLLAGKKDKLKPEDIKRKIQEIINTTNY